MSTAARTHWGARLLRLLWHAAALAGALLVLGAAAVAFSPALRTRAELLALEWLSRNVVEEAESEDEALPSDPGAARRATALPLSALTPSQAAVAQHLAKLYHVAPEPVAALVAEAYRQGPKLGLEPNLLLAVAAIESNFHPYVESAAGAQGLMQVMPKIHRKRLEGEGGAQAVFDPVVSLRIGAKILHECVRISGGSVEGGLRFYLGGGRAEKDTSDAYIKKIAEIKAPLDQLSASNAR